MPYIQIYIHLAWATKNRIPFLSKEIRHQVFNQIKEYAFQKSIIVDHINGHKEHVHCLISLKADQNIATILNLLKGESSHWINKNKLTSSKFGWQDEYFAVSVGTSKVEKVRNYIRNQEKHHDNKSWKEECREFIEKYGFEFVKG